MDSVWFRPRPGANFRGPEQKNDPLTGTWTLNEEKGYQLTGPLKYESAGENGVRYIDSDGGTCVAQPDGKDYKCEGTGVPATVSLKMIDLRTVEEQRNGGAFGSEVARFVIFPDGQRMTITREAVRPDGSHYRSERIWEKQ